LKIRIPKRSVRAKKSKRRSFAKLPGVILLVTLLGLASYTLGWSHLLAVKRIVVTAGQEEQLVTSLIIPNELSLGQPLARIDVAKISRSLSGLSWVSHQAISRNWLNGRVGITVSARTPVASFSAADGTTHYLDSHGVDFQLPVAPPAAPAIPVITFANPGEESRQMAARLVPQLPQDLLVAMSSLKITASGNAVMVTSLPGFKKLTVAWGDSSLVSLKVNILRHLLALPENAKISYVDVSDTTAPLVK